MLLAEARQGQSTPRGSHTQGASSEVTGGFRAVGHPSHPYPSPPARSLSPGAPRCWGRPRLPLMQKHGLTVCVYSEKPTSGDISFPGHCCLLLRLHLEVTSPFPTQNTVPLGSAGNYRGPQAIWEGRRPVYIHEPQGAGLWPQKQPRTPSLQGIRKPWAPQWEKLPPYTQGVMGEVTHP